MGKSLKWLQNVLQCTELRIYDHISIKYNSLIQFILKNLKEELEISKLVDKIKTDFETSSTLNAESSPKTTYTFLLFGLEREFFGQIISGASTEQQISDGFACIVAFCPDKPIREKNSTISLKSNLI